jgi:hypothetical protein
MAANRKPIGSFWTPPASFRVKIVKQSQMVDKLNFIDLTTQITLLIKGQLNSEWIYEVIVSRKMPTKIFKDFCPTKQTKIMALFFGEFLVSLRSFFGFDPCLFGRAEILKIFGNDDLINSFWI